MKILGSGDESDPSSHEGGRLSPTAVPMSAPIHTHQPDWSLPSSSAAGGVAASNPGPPPANLHHGGSKSNIREKLRKFFLRRPTMDDLFRRGIIRNEPVFGSTLRDLFQAECLHQQHQGAPHPHPPPSPAEFVPAFVRRCVAEIERDVERLRTDGVYRQSGNLSHVQRIRLQVNEFDSVMIFTDLERLVFVQVDQGNWSVLESVEDVHVLTGALKLFFRELKEPLIPWECVSPLLAAANGDSGMSKKQRSKRLRELVSGDRAPCVPSVHRSTLAVLLRHLLRVTEEQRHNRMQIPNLAIVFGPTLMWPPSNAAAAGASAASSSSGAAQQQQQNLALGMMQQNIIVEALLNNFDVIFGGSSK